MNGRLLPESKPRTARALAVFTARLRQMREDGFGDPAQVEDFRRRARAAKLTYLSRPEYWLEMLCQRFEDAGGRVHLAGDAAEARGLIEGICEAAGVSKVVKSKSMLGEEIGLNPALEARGVEVTETDLGEFIIQLAGERPFHILGPAMHKDRGQIAELFSDRLGITVGDDPAELTQAARRVLRERFLAAQAGITGVNVAACATGTLALITNEGNGRYCAGLPPVHIAVMGLEKAVPTLADLAMFVTLIPRAALGARLPSYVTLAGGSLGRAGGAGPRQRHLVVLDNGRSAILSSRYWEMLLCLRCASCLNFCPVYGLAGGHNYPGAYPGPMGSVLSQLLCGQEGGEDLVHASTLCGRCRQMCPMGIDLPGMLLALRGEMAEKGVLGQLSNLAAGLAAEVLSRRPLFEAAKAGGRGLLRVLDAWEPRPLPPGPWRAWRRAGRRLPSASGAGREGRRG